MVTADYKAVYYTTERCHNELPTSIGVDTRVICFAIGFIVPRHAKSP